MAIQTSISIGDLLTLIADVLTILLLVIAVIGIFLTRQQIKQNYDVQKATFFKEIYLTLLCEEGIRDTFYLIDHQKFVFDAKFWESDLEQPIDSLLCFVDMVCGLYAAKMLTKVELDFFEYEFRQIYSNPNIQAYLHYLKDLYVDIQAATKPFSNFILYCENELRCNPAIDTIQTDTASSLYNLANRYRDLGNYNVAEPLYQRALTIREEALGPTHPNTNTIRETYDKLKQQINQQNKDKGAV